ncbi:MAG: processing protein, partial [Frankiaceae bacterium]|nr:processing protein [Frankiaceae bacterium]
MSVGCHQFLRDRPDAVLVTKAAEVIEQCGHMGELAEREVGPARTRDALGPVVGRVLEGVPVQRHAAVASIATAAGVSPDVAAAALAALASAGLVESRDGGWAMTTEGRRDRKSRRCAEAAELPLDWW